MRICDRQFSLAENIVHQSSTIYIWSSVHNVQNDQRQDRMAECQVGGGQGVVRSLASCPDGLLPWPLTPVGLGPSSLWVRGPFPDPVFPGSLTQAGRRVIQNQWSRIAKGMSQIRLGSGWAEGYPICTNFMHLGH